MDNPAAQFGFTKLVVSDLEACAAFYTSVCGLIEWQRVDSVIAGRPMSEIMFQPTSPGAGTFVLLSFHGSTATGRDEIITGFITPDIELFVARAATAGGRIVEAVKARPEHGVKVAFVEDVEGHLIEVVELL